MPIPDNPTMKVKQAKMKVDLPKDWQVQERFLHTKMLATPRPAQIAPWPNPELVQSIPREIPKSALTFKTTKRLKMLSQYQERKFSPQYVRPKSAEHIVPLHTLEFEITPRLLELSVPPNPEEALSKKLERLKKLSKIEEQLKELEMLHNKRRDNLIARGQARLKKALEQRAQQYEQQKKKTLKDFNQEDFWKNVDKLAEPRQKIILKYEDPHEEARKANARMQRIRDYKATPRTLELSRPRELHEEYLLDIKYNPHIVKRAALSKANEANDRIRALANLGPRSEPVKKKIKI